ncbi:hydroxypyruvate isomerase family protein [Flavimaricola marinus]|uniref:Putative hydroxypyruvate isomerase YgbM n=1 Tax=Flavimaricola marinus TaxID=1819565 RepID=A0A238LLT1_9RHOB|nr:TIM barrel protein [Flavimaricola marinus]SMY10355.1 Putative hydroxypyruvate isomerase YgbM [Flavimaricola marinus]
MRFSANLGFLWADLPLPDAIRAAKNAGFDAVECHWPYGTASADVRTALDEAGLEMLGLNTSRGDVSAGENGLAALPGRVDDAQAAIDQAITYASEIGCKAVHVMAGFASGPEAHDTFAANLAYACAQAKPHGITILIEPLNRYDAPGYFLTTTTQAVDLIDTIDTTNLKLMFDCYHVQLMEGDLTHKLADLMPYIGHIQFASVPDRGPPATGEVNYDHVFNVISALGYDKPLGAEYKPNGPTADTLGWLRGR